MTIPQLWLMHGLAPAIGRKTGLAAVYEEANRKRAAKGLPRIEPPRAKARPRGRRK